jgi:LacI family transcriptional regulator
MTITIRQLAHHLNLSITTVSRALDGYPDVAESTRQRVTAAARELGYEPSYAARHLRRSQTDVLGYILPATSPRFSDPFFNAFLTGLCDEAPVQQFDLLIASSPPGDPAEMALYRHWILSDRVDGFIINRTRLHDPRIDLLTAENRLFAALGSSSFTSQTPNYPYIEVDQRAGMSALVAHLASRGHRRIAFIGADAELVIQHERYHGFLKALENNNLPFEDQLTLTGDLSEETGRTCADQLLNLPNPPTAIIGVNDLTALGALDAVKRRGLLPGRQVAVAGFDGIPETAHTSPPLTTVAQPTYDIARQLVRLLVERIRGIPHPIANLLIHPQLIIRPSTLD